ncbi:hypothetical protein [Streptococcus ovis]|uniref:hypothetical protein n=1 Tax=Streptococcus ovis TaxID=82806 RepID=UPI0003746276|nr:hypothetical protein [Streptococcus ovis]
MARKKKLQDYKKPLEKIEKELAKIARDKQDLAEKETQLKREYSARHADYIMFLVSESELSAEDLEDLLLSGKSVQIGDK